jgi:hypothetical protein
VFFRVDFDTEMVEEIDPAKLARNWRSYPAPGKIQAVGDDWAARGEKTGTARSERDCTGGE